MISSTLRFLLAIDYPLSPAPLYEFITGPVFGGQVNPLTLRPGLLATDVALRTISEALTKAACRSLELETNELQAEYRPALTAAGREGREAEIYLYDTLPGGAGFAKRAGELGLAVFEEALEILEECPDDCDRSCYRCLRSYKNKFEHELLDRHLGASLLRFLIHGSDPTMDSGRLESSTTLLFEDLRRQDLDGVAVERNHILALPDLRTVTAPIYVKQAGGREFIIGLHGPLTPDTPPNDALSRDSPDQTNFPGYSSFWDTVKYNPAFQGRQMRPDSLKFPVFI